MRCDAEPIFGSGGRAVLEEAGLHQGLFHHEAPRVQQVRVLHALACPKRGGGGGGG